MKLESEKILDAVLGDESVQLSELVERTELDIQKVVELVWELEWLWILQYTSSDDFSAEKLEIQVSKSYLDKFNLELHKQTLKTKKSVESRRLQKWYVHFESYTINNLKENFLNAFPNEEWINCIDDIELTYVDRKQINSDISIKIPSLLQKYSQGGVYINEKIPYLINILNNSRLKRDWKIKKIEAKGIYINITLSDSYLFQSLWQISELWDNFWESDIHKGEAIIVDYSSPNTAKHLHAWHIRSTIIWHVLSNLYDATWYFTHRMNHINDWGGFWQLLVWYNKWRDVLPKFEIENDMLFFIYSMFRKWEKAALSKDNFENFSEDNYWELKKYYGDFSCYEDFCKLFEEFMNESKESFTSLENWDKDKVEIWQKMVQWSMKDFERFYWALWIHQDYAVGESFYSNMWRNLVKRLENKRVAVFYTQELADADIMKNKKEFEEWRLEEVEYYSIKNEILNDVWCYVVTLPNFERFVVLKADSSTIYATRDLAAIDYRTKVFSPSRIVYEVWQEQAEHFDKLFKSARKLWIDETGFSHIYHGFYVDLDSKKKLSSRDWASNVLNLINKSIEYFEKKYADDDKGFTADEITDISKKLAIGSIVFNDIKKDKKTSVGISSDIDKTCKTFEESWGAYIIYSICRANSIMNKAGSAKYDIWDFKGICLESIEKTIINELTRYPIIVKNATKHDNPAILTDYLSKLARNYNSYYASCPVLNDGNEYRLIITGAVKQVLSNGMKLCHIEIPERI